MEYIYKMKKAEVISISKKTTHIEDYKGYLSNLQIDQTIKHILKLKGVEYTSNT